MDPVIWTKLRRNQVRILPLAPLMLTLAPGDFFCLIGIFEVFRLPWEPHC